jgi:hypothetical protein
VEGLIWCEGGWLDFMGYLYRTLVGTVVGTGGFAIKAMLSDKGLENKKIHKGNLLKEMEYYFYSPLINISFIISYPIY